MVQVRIGTWSRNDISGIEQAPTVSVPHAQQKNNGTPYAYHNASVANIVNDLLRAGKNLTKLEYFFRDGKYTIVATFTAGTAIAKNSSFEELIMKAYDGYLYVNPNNTVTINCARKSKVGGSAIALMFPN